LTLAERNAIGILAITAAAVVGGIVVYDPPAIVTVAVLPGIVAVTMLSWSALRGNDVAVLLLVFIAVFLIQAVFRVREYEDKEVDFQVMLKIAVWVIAVAVALVHAPRWLGAILSPINMTWIMLLLWLFVTAAVSPSPLYTAGSAFTVFACVVLCAYVFSVFEPFVVLATMVVSIVVFCIISLIVYFAVPEFGHYVYWLDGQRFISPRLAGISGSANNMGRMAAFGLVIMALYPLEFYRLHRLLMPLSALIMAIALVMTNSRTSMMNVGVIALAVYTLNWRRSYLLAFAISLALLGAVILIPAGDEALKLLSRHGKVEEVTSMTGRTDIWYAVLKLSEAKPWTGYGYGSSVFVLPQHEREVGFLTSHAHNLFLQLLLTTGWTGVILFTLCVLGVGLRAMATGGRVALAMMAFVLLNGITEASGFTTLANICTLAFAIAVTIPPLRYDKADYADYSSYQRRFS
jgi:O-antigen ligase